MRLARVETALEAHVERCDDERARNAGDIVDLRNSNHKVRADMQTGLSRAHARIDDVSTSVTEIKTKLDAIPDKIAAALREAILEGKHGVSESKVWAVARGLSFIGMAIGVVIALLK